MNDDATFDMLKAAVRSARDLQIQKVALLRAHLLRLFPDGAAQIDEALQLWADYEAGKPRHD